MRMRGGGIFDDIINKFKPSTDAEKCQAAKENVDEICMNAKADESVQAQDSMQEPVSQEPVVSQVSAQEPVVSQVSAQESPQEPIVSAQESPQEPAQAQEPYIAEIDETNAMPNVDNYDVERIGGANKSKKKHKKRSHSRRKKTKSKKHKK
jgi:hypothetical protein